MIAEFVDAWFTVILAATAWVAAGGGLAALTVLAAARWLYGRWSAPRARRTPRAHPAHERPPHTPLWTRSQPLAYEETA
ncbi:hypothetical protein ACFW2V_02855 [Streptomyces sp. NPDC058947]|uniref:hypothetical protein n=1 Tax=Streptomyces sp. NPDC058947 TaxID=3346675 RepID=UPI00367F35EA